MRSKEFFSERIEHELTTAGIALTAGNDGKARVCARRAAGLAITWFCSQFPRPAWHTDAMSQLRHLKDDESFSSDVRDAATRLTTRITERFTYPFSTDPIEDARIIVNAITKLMDDHAHR